MFLMDNRIDNRSDSSAEWEINTDELEIVEIEIEKNDKTKISRDEIMREYFRIDSRLNYIIARMKKRKKFIKPIKN